MKSANHISKRALAFFLLSLFVSVHAIKMLHSHNNAAATHLAFDGVVVEKKGDCTICDYHLAKDAATFETYVDLQKPFFVNLSIPFYKHQPTTSIGLTFTDRGPPAFA